jgi:hypothetical protein
VVLNRDQGVQIPRIGEFIEVDHSIGFMLDPLPQETTANKTCAAGDQEGCHVEIGNAGRLELTVRKRFS